MPFNKISRLFAIAALAVALAPAAYVRAGADADQPAAVANPHSIDAAAMASVPRYFDGSSLLVDDLIAGPFLAQDPAQAAALQRFNIEGIESCNMLPAGGGACGAGGSYGSEVSCRPAGASGHGSGWGSGMNTYGSGGW